MIKESAKDDGLHVISQNMHIWHNIHIATKLEMKMLNHLQYGILTQLRTEHIRIQYYIHKLHHYSYYKEQHRHNHHHIQHIRCTLSDCECKDGICQFCNDNKYGNVKHLILECPQIDIMREQYITPCINLVRRTYHTSPLPLLQALLFPPKNVRWHHRKMILSSITDFVLRSNHLKRNSS
eukprot:463944_1